MRAQRAARLAQLPFVRSGRLRRLPPPLSAWTRTRDLRGVARSSFRDWWRSAMSVARTEILARIAAISRAPQAAPERMYRTAGILAPDAVVDLFCERVADYRAEVRRCTTETVAEQIAEVAAAQGATRFGIPAGLQADWRPTGCDLLPDTSLDTPGLDSLDGAITGCTVAIAETGTIVLPPAARQVSARSHSFPTCTSVSSSSRRSSSSSPSASPARCARQGKSRPITLVSGPSATSDIELSRVEGVHGPRRLVVLVTG